MDEPKTPEEEYADNAYDRGYHLGRAHALREVERALEEFAATWEARRDELDTPTLQELGRIAAVAHKQVLAYIRERFREEVSP